MLRRLALVLSSSLLFACQASVTPSKVEEPAAKPLAERPAAAADDVSKAAEKATEKATAQKQKQKELRQKERELEAARVEGQIQQIDRAMREAGVAASLRRTATELAKAKQDLELFLAEVKPRELEERRIGLDQSIYRADHSKDELGELVAMYQADEFAKTTKELVLKRGRRELESAERYLAVARAEFAHFEKVTQPQRERELRDKVVDAELERSKAEHEAEKAKLELGLQAQKHEQRLGDLAEEIADLRAELAKGSS
ncbi:MAG: hypothetical protein U1F60_01985 [Planctomycetota bacterium]